MSSFDVRTPESVAEGRRYITADKQRFLIWEDLCNDTTARFKCKDIGPSQDE